jgi:hypothetical protein
MTRVGSQHHRQKKKKLPINYALMLRINVYRVCTAYSAGDIYCFSKALKRRDCSHFILKIPISFSTH